MSIAAVVLAGLGVHYLATSLLFGWSGWTPWPRPTASSRTTPTRWLAQAGLSDISGRAFVAATLATAAAGALLGATLFGSALSSGVLLTIGAAVPLAAHHQRRRRRRSRSRAQWPAIIEEIRVLTGSVGLSVPHALFEAGGRTPPEMRWAFVAAEREWQLTTDFEQTTRQLKADLADPTADVVLETLLVAHDLGATGLGPRLSALAEDRVRELNGRRDARARQAGARFARLFVLLVPLGMTLAGLSLGSGRHAYSERNGQMLVVVSIVLIAACWLWASHLLRVPTNQRVFDR